MVVRHLYLYQLSDFPKRSNKLMCSLDGWPSSVSMTLDYLKICLTVYSDDTEYGIFHKISGPTPEHEM